jgi:fused signal recognition particle receptor
MPSWRQALSRTRDRLAGSFSKVFQRDGEVDDVSLEELEETLLQADVPARLVGDLIESIENEKPAPGLTRRERLRRRLLATLGSPEPVRWEDGTPPFTVLIVGVNGSGKTTTAAKLAHLAGRSGHRPILGAADTFRAAGSEQLRIWAERVGCDAVTGASGADAAAVAYDSLDAALARGRDVLIVDTAGRMHTKGPLMQELQKVHRALGKRAEGMPQEVWIVLDATIGQNALIQARVFNEVVPLTGVIIAKLDGSSKAGFLFGVARELKVPILFAGLGEQADDLVPFDAAAFVDALLGFEDSVERAEA